MKGTFLQIVARGAKRKKQNVLNQQDLGFLQRQAHFENQNDKTNIAGHTRMGLNGILESLENLVEKKQQVLCLVTIYNEE